MNRKESLADARQFVVRTFEEIDGRRPTKKAIEQSAKKIATALRSVVDTAATKPDRR